MQRLVMEVDTMVLKQVERKILMCCLKVSFLCCRRRRRERLANPSSSNHTGVRARYLLDD